MAQQLKALVALPEDLGFLTTHMAAHNCNFSSLTEYIEAEHQDTSNKQTNKTK